MENRRAKIWIVILCTVCLAASSVACTGGGDAENAGSRQQTGKEGLPPSDETEPSVEPEIVEAAPIPAEKEDAYQNKNQPGLTGNVDISYPVIAGAQSEKIDAMLRRCVETFVNDVYEEGDHSLAIVLDSKISYQNILMKAWYSKMTLRTDAEGHPTIYAFDQALDGYAIDNFLFNIRQDTT